jgi:hypothetical protein
MRHHRTAAGLALLVAVTLLFTASLQAQQSSSQPAPRPAPELSKERHVEGTVSKVDAMGKTVGVSTGLFGLIGRTVQVDEGTRIRVQGQPAPLTEVKEGDRIKASYEVRDGKNIAKLIDVTAEKLDLAPSPPARSGTPASPPTQ